MAFAGTVVEGRALDPAGRAYLLEHVEDRIRRRPGHLALYRTTVRTLARLAGRPFAELPVAERIELLTRHRLADFQASAEETDSGPLPDDMRAIRKQVVEDLIGGYYGSPAGWAIVDYQVFPGRCGDLTRYTRAES
jgi:hypothetical protein